MQVADLSIVTCLVIAVCHSAIALSVCFNPSSKTIIKCKTNRSGQFRVYPGLHCQVPNYTQHTLCRCPWLMASSSTRWRQLRGRCEVVRLPSVASSWCWLATSTSCRRWQRVQTGRRRGDSPLKRLRGASAWRCRCSLSLYIDR